MVEEDEAESEEAAEAEAEAEVMRCLNSCWLCWKEAEGAAAGPAAAAADEGWMVMTVAMAEGIYDRAISGISKGDYVTYQELRWMLHSGAIRWEMPRSVGWAPGRPMAGVVELEDDIDGRGCLSTTPPLDDYSGKTLAVT